MGDNESKTQAGAFELKKALIDLVGSSQIKALELMELRHLAISQNVSSPILLESSGHQVTITKRSSSADSGSFDFQFIFRTYVIANRTEWWPTSFVDHSGHTIKAESIIGSRTLTNVAKQNEIIVLASTWAKSLNSQSLTRTVDGVI